MARMHHFVGLTALSLLTLATGCVSQEKYNAQRMRADQYAEQLAAAQSQVNSSTAQNDVFRSQMERARASQDNQGALIVNQAAQITELTRQLEEMNSRYQSAMANIGKAGATPLPIALINELTAFAQQNPDVVEFDEKRGLVKFKSDVTFSAGSAIVKPEAKLVIDRFAAILNGPAASQYELMVAGHTDSTPVSNEQTKRAGHHDNWYLSAHRAISVSKELQGQAVSPRRIEVAGFADQKPVAANDTEPNKAKNRRVEVFILPTTLGGSPAPAPAAVPASAVVPAPAKPAPAIGGPNKDGATTGIDVKPYINK